MEQIEKKKGLQAGSRPQAGVPQAGTARAVRDLRGVWEEHQMWGQRAQTGRRPGPVLGGEHQARQTDPRHPQLESALDLQVLRLGAPQLCALADLLSSPAHLRARRQLSPPQVPLRWLRLSSPISPGRPIGGPSPLLRPWHIPLLRFFTALLTGKARVCLRSVTSQGGRDFAWFTTWVNIR